MENQHRQIKGYRELSAEEIAMMNEVKDLGLQLQAVVTKVQAHVTAQFNSVQAIEDNEDAGMELTRLLSAEPDQWAHRGKQNLQDGLMCLTRAIAQPTFF